MTHIDDRIRSALEAEDQELYDQLDPDMGLQDLILGPFKGKMRWLAALAMVYMLIFGGLTIYCGFQFYAAVETKALLAWGGGCFLSMLAVGFLKMWFFLEMQKNTILRQLKRVELQIAHVRDISASNR